MSWLQRSLCPAFALSLVIGCTSEDDPDDPVLRVCEAELTTSEFAEFLDGNLVIVAAYTEQGSSAGEMLGGLFVGLVFNGLDFANLGSTVPTFQDGAYTLTNGTTELGFTLYWAEDWQDHTAGAPIEYNLFDPDSYITNLSVSNIDIVRGTVEVDYDEGPLFDLVDGEVEIDPSNPLDVSFRVRLRTDLIAFDAFSSKAYMGMPPRDADELQIMMRTTQASLTGVVDQFRAGGFGFSYDGTAYDSVYYDIDQVFDSSTFLITQDDDGSWFWQGDYQSTVTKGGQTLYQSGTVSNLDENTTAYFCDAGRTARIGVARHRLDLAGGTFEFDGSDDTVVYGLEPF